MRSYRLDWNSIPFKWQRHRKLVCTCYTHNSKQNIEVIPYIVYFLVEYCGSESSDTRKKKKIWGARQQLRKVAYMNTFINIRQASGGGCPCQERSLTVQSEALLIYLEVNKIQGEHHVTESWKFLVWRWQILSIGIVVIHRVLTCWQQRLLLFSFPPQKPNAVPALQASCWVPKGKVFINHCFCTTHHCLVHRLVSSPTNNKQNPTHQ